MTTPSVLCDIKGMDNATWLAAREHGPDGSIPYTLGGSNISTIFDINPWETALELWLAKKGRIQKKQSKNPNKLQMGHLMEPILAKIYGIRTGNKVIEDTNMYQHSKYPFALANIDYRVEENGTVGILECKTTGYEYRYIWLSGQAPPYYVLQVRFYMAVLDLDFADIICCWSMDFKKDSKIIRIKRDLRIEKQIMDRAAAFIKSLEDSMEPELKAVSPELALSALAHIYKKSGGPLPTIELGCMFADKAQRIEAIQTEIEGLEEQIGPQQEKLKELKKEVAAESVEIIAAMKSHEYGFVEVDDEQYSIEFPYKPRTGFDKEQLRKDNPELYDKYVITTYSRKLSVKKQQDNSTV